MRRWEYVPTERKRQVLRKRTNKMDIRNQPDKVFKVMPIRKLTWKKNEHGMNFNREILKRASQS